MGVFTTAGDTAFTRMPSLASSIAKCCVNECKPAFAIEYAEEGGSLHSLLGPLRADFHDGADHSSPRQTSFLDRYELVGIGSVTFFAFDNQMGVGIGSNRISISARGF